MSLRILRAITLLVIAVTAFTATSAKAQSDLYVVNFFGSKVTRHNASTGALISTIDVSRPTGAEIGPDGNLYTVGYDGAIRRWNPNTGSLLATLATNIATFPDDLHFGPDGNIYIACEFGPGILRYDTNGNPLPSTGNTGAVFFFGPNNRFISSAFGRDGNLYVTDGGSNQVFRFSPSGSLLGAFVTTDLHIPIDLRFGPDGNLYVANRETNNVSRFDGTTGAFLGVFASGSGLDKTDSFDFGPDGNLYVASRNTNVILRFDGSTGAFIDTFISTNLNDPYRIRFFGTTTVKISRVTPASVKVNSAAFQMTITGVGFAGNSSVRFNNTAVSVVSATTSALVVNVPANLLTAARTYNVTVVTGANVSNAVPFRVTSSAVSNTPPNLKIVGVPRTGSDPLSGVKYSVLLIRNSGGSDATGIAFNDVRFYFDRNNPSLYVTPTGMILEPGGTPPGNLSKTAPGEILQIRWDWPTTINGPVRNGVISIRGTTVQGAFNAGTQFLQFP